MPSLRCSVPIPGNSDFHQELSFDLLAVFVVHAHQSYALRTELR
jgi:hypothetical protein